MNVQSSRISGISALWGAVIASVVLLAWPASAQTLNGFDLSERSIALDAIQRGGPPRDGIPALTDPKFVAPNEVPWLEPDERVLGVAYKGIARAYPLGIMNYHEIVNDRFGDGFLAVTYCPLCFTGAAFRADDGDGGRRLFGVSGLLFDSDVLLYDRETESLWSQIAGRAVAGPRLGESLDSVPVTNTTWENWRQEHPDTRVLSRDTAYSRDYDRDPYAAYAEDEALMFPVRFRSQGLHPKTRVFGLVLGGESRAYPFAAFPESGRYRLEDHLGGAEVKLVVDADAESARAYRGGEEIAGLTSYWFAWFTFHPETALYDGEPAPEPVDR